MATESDKVTFVVEMDGQQLQVVVAALDMYLRMGMGQLDVSVDEFLRTHFYPRYYEALAPGAGTEGSSHVTRGALVRSHINDIKALVFLHPPNGSWGVGNRKVPRVCREAYDVLQVLRKTWADHRTATGTDLSYTVWARDYLPANPEWPPVTCKVKKDADT